MIPHSVADPQISPSVLLRARGAGAKPSSRSKGLRSQISIINRHSPRSLLSVFNSRPAITTMVLPFRAELTVVTVSEANSREFWAARLRRKQLQQRAFISLVRSLGVFETAPIPPCRVVLTRLGRRMDSDNLAGSLKHIRDAIAAWIGVDDGCEAIVWEYQQEPGKGLVRIDILGRSQRRRKRKGPGR